MIRKDREITERQAIIGIMKRCHVCRLAINDPVAGFPYIVPMNFGIVEDGDAVSLSFHCAKRGYKLDLLKNDARVTFEMECDVELVYNPAHGHNTDIFKSVIGHGIVETVEAMDEKVRLLSALVDRYHDEKIDVSEQDAARCTILKLSVLDFTGKEKKVK